MNRAFKTQFHNNYVDEKPIVTMSVTVNNGKRFKDLDNEGKRDLVECLLLFKKSLEGFTAEVIQSINLKK